jgi:lipoate-protein ligase B
MRKLEARNLGRMGWVQAYHLQRELVEQRKQGVIPDQFLLVEHPHVITMGRNGRMDNLLADEDVLRRAGIEFHQTDRGGDITYHGPGQIVGYPIVDLKEWKRDVGAYVRSLEQVILATLADFNIAGERAPGMTGVWVRGAKLAAIGVHISRWVTSHGFALNLETDLSYFQYIVPCGLTRPVISMRALGSHASRLAVSESLVRRFGAVYQYESIEQPALATESV